MQQAETTPVAQAPAESPHPAGFGTTELQRKSNRVGRGRIVLLLAILGCASFVAVLQWIPSQNAQISCHFSQSWHFGMAKFREVQFDHGGTRIGTGFVTHYQLGPFVLSRYHSQVLTFQPLGTNTPTPSTRVFDPIAGYDFGIVVETNRAPRVR